MRRLMQTLVLASLGHTSLLLAQSPPPQREYPPLRTYMMARDAEIALATSAAPANISGQATIKVLTTSGYQVARAGENGFVCLVLRGWAAPMFTVPERDLVYDATLRAPICYNAVAVRTVLPYQELRTRLALEGKGPDQIAAGVHAAYAKGQLPSIETVGFAYMLSADQHLGPGGAFHPHMMVFAPYNTDALLGGNERNGPLPFVSDDPGTPFAVTVIRVDDKLAIKVQP